MHKETLKLEKVSTIMKKLLFGALINCGFIALAYAADPQEQQPKKEEKFICSRNNQSDSVFTDVYKSEDECGKYCTGIGTVCEPTGKRTDVDTEDVAD